MVLVDNKPSFLVQLQVTEQDCPALHDMMLARKVYVRANGKLYLNAGDVQRVVQSGQEPRFFVRVIVPWARSCEFIDQFGNHLIDYRVPTSA